MTTSLADITALVTAYSDEQRQPTLDALAQEKAYADTLEASLNAAEVRAETAEADRDAIKAQLALYVAKYGPLVDVIMLPANFPNHSAGLWNGKGWVGKGKDITQYKMKDNSSQRAAAIAAIVAPDTNPFNLMWMAGTDVGQWAVDDAVASDFSLFGPSLGHTYGGLFVGPGNRAKVQRVGIYGIQGKLNGPPEETGSLSMWRQFDGLIEDFILDGRNAGGTAIASSPLMLSSATRTTIRNGDIGGAAFGFGAANWRGMGLTTYTNVNFHNNRKHLNIEQAEPDSEYVFDRCTFDTPLAASYIVQISTRSKGRCKLTFRDCIMPPKIGARVWTAAANAGQNGMLDSDIRIIDKGVDVTTSRLTFVRT